MKMMNKFIIGIIAGIILFFSLLIGIALAQTPLPQPTDFVSDYAHVLSEKQRTVLDIKLAEYQKKTTNEIAVVTVDTTGDQTIEEYATAIGDQWKPGVKGKDNGIILLLAIKDHHDRIEVGRGLQGNLTDIQANGILQDMIPQLKQSDYDGAVTTGVNEIISTLGGSDGSNDTTASSGGSSNAGDDMDGLIGVGFLLLIIIIIIVIIGAVKSSGSTDDSSDDDSDSESSSDSGIGDALLGGVAGYAAGKASSRDDSDDSDDSDYHSSSSSDDDDDSSSSSSSGLFGGGFSGGGDSFGGFSGGSFDGGGSSSGW